MSDQTIEQEHSSDEMMTKKEFDALRQQVFEIEKLRWDHYMLWKKYTDEYNNLRRKLQYNCDHKMEVDYNQFDPCRTPYKCSRCGSC